MTIDDLGKVFRYKEFKQTGNIASPLFMTQNNESYNENKVIQPLKLEKFKNSSLIYSQSVIIPDNSNN